MILKKLKYSIYLVFINYINFLLMDFINTICYGNSIILILTNIKKKN